VSNINIFNNTFYGNEVGLNIRPMMSATVHGEQHFREQRVSYANVLNRNPGNVITTCTSAEPWSRSQRTDIGSAVHQRGGGDFSLQSASPAINAGDPNTLTNSAGTLDFAGNRASRVDGSI